MDAFALEAHLQGLAIEAPALANRARHPDIGEEIHFQPIGAVALARLAAAPRLVEAKAARLVAAHLRFGQLGKEGADLVEDLDVSRGIGARRATDRRLIDVDDFVNVLGAGDSIVFADRSALAVERLFFLVAVARRVCSRLVAL